MASKLRMAIFLALAGAGVTISLISAQERRPIVLDRAPVRMVQDPYPTFNGIAMNSERGEIIMADDNRSSLLAYDVEFEPSERSTEARRHHAVIARSKTIGSSSVSSTKRPTA